MANPQQRFHGALLGAVCAVSLLAGGCRESHSHSSGALEPAYEQNFHPRPYTGRIEPDDGQWVRPAKDFASTRYSTLDQITTENVPNLRLAWKYDTGLKRGQEAAPIVVNNMMYVVMPWPNALLAFDLTRPGPALKWKYEPRPSPAAQGIACCDVVNRGAAYAFGKIYYNTLDNNTVAVDANTGKEVWKTKLGDLNKGETMTMAPLVVKNKVLVGNSGGEFGVRGWVTALDAQTGKIAWRAYMTGPDSEVLIGPRYKPFYDQYKAKDLGIQSWPPDAWKIGGGSMWGWISYDPELDLIYHGTANPGPWTSELRPGDNHFTSGLFARDPDTGEAIWYYQFSPHDLYDYDGINENIILDLPIKGQMRRVVVRPERNGYVYVIDRATGEVLMADPFAHITTTRGVDLKTGLLQYVEEKKPRMNAVVRNACPAPPGAKDWTPSTFSAKTGLLYLPHNNLCQDIEELNVNYIAGTPYVGTNNRMYKGPGGHGGEFTAWDPVEGKVVWTLKEEYPVWSGSVSTAGDVVFYGTMTGVFKAVDAYTGKLLWQYQTDSGIIGQPVTYRGPDGKQYVAILSGIGGWAGALVAGGLDARDSSAALGFVNAVKGLERKVQKGGTLYVFALP
jgi:lanthanide-dependent methanol dehydrogenase